MWKPNQVPPKQVLMDFMIKMSMLLKNKSFLSMLSLGRFKLLGNIKPMTSDCKASWLYYWGNSFPILHSLPYSNLRGFGGQLKEQHRLDCQTPPLDGWLEQRGRVKVFLRYFLCLRGPRVPSDSSEEPWLGVLSLPLLILLLVSFFFGLWKLFFSVIKAKYICKN